MRRIALVLPIRFAFGMRAVQTTTREISTEGAFVRCIEPPREGTQVALRIYLPGLSTAAEFVGVVRDVEQAQETGFWAEFISANAGAKEKLHAVLFPRRSDPALGAAPVPIGAVQPTRSAVVADEQAVVPSTRQRPPSTPTSHVAQLAHAPPESAPAATPASDADNRRTFPRYRARFGVRFASVQDFVLEYAANISAGGVFVVTDHPPDMHAVITVTMELPGGGGAVSCKAVVVHRVSKEQGLERKTPAGAGVQFIDADDAFREKIDKALEYILAHGT